MLDITDIKKYKCRWYGLSFTKRGRRHYDKRRLILHAINIEIAKTKALQIFGSMPDYIQRI